MSGFVVDANTTIAWLFGESAHAGKLPKDFGEASLVVPWLWRAETTNVILVAERRKRITEAQGIRFLQILDALEAEVVGEPLRRQLEALASFARPHQLTAYDALYLELAVSLGLPLCTLDHGLQAAARRLGVELIIDREVGEGE
ncbi:MAG TPA: type II toxin-antitoxin system VapC family toxin [Candidatus Krumholzibacteria bacterium]